MSRAELRLIAAVRAARKNPELLQGHLWEACRKGYSSAAIAAIDFGADPNRPHAGWLPLEAAADADRLEVIELLLRAGADPNGGEVMARAGAKSLPLLIAAGGRVDDTPGGLNPLLRAIAGRRKQDRALELLRLGASVNVTDSNGATPLMLAARHGRYATFVALLKRGADPMAVDTTGRSALRYAVEAMAGGSTTPASEIPSVRRLFRELRTLLPAQPEDIVLAAIASGDSSELKRQLDAGLDPETRISGAINWLGVDLMALVRSSATLDDLMSIPMDAQSRDGHVSGCTLLMWAIALHQQGCVRVLLDAGADVNAEMVNGVSAGDISLHSAMAIRKMIGTTGLDAFTHLPGTRKFKPRPAETRSNSRVERLGVFAERIAAHHASFQKYHADADHSHCPDYHVAGFWGHAAVLYVEERTQAMRETLRQVIGFGERYFNSAPTPTTDSAKHDSWVEVFTRTAAACVSLGEWHKMQKLCSYPDETWRRPGRTSWYDPCYYDWPFWILFARDTIGSGDTMGLRQIILGERGKGAKLLLSLHDAIAAGNARVVNAAVRKYLAFHRSHVTSKKHGIAPDRVVSAEATILVSMARRRGMVLSLGVREADLLISSE